MTSLACTIQDSQEQQQTPNLAFFFTQIQNQLEVEEFFAKIRAQSSSKKTILKQISPKMRAKLLTWLEKLAICTFKFRRTTYIISALILDQFLEKNDPTPSSLQLLGCTSLFIASKLGEQIIVDPECYTTASCNIYSKKQLLQEEKIVYSQINWKKIRTGIHRAVKLGCERLNLDVRRAEEIACLLLLQEQFSIWKQSKQNYTVLSLAKIDSNEPLSNTQIITLIKQI